MSVDGKWNVTIASPIGDQKGVLDVRSDGDKVTGTVAAMGGTMPIEDGVLNGDTMTFAFQMSQPIATRVDVDVVVSGDALDGTAVAGPLGERRIAGARA